MFVLFVAIMSSESFVYIDAFYSPALLQYLLMCAEQQQQQHINSNLPRSIYAVCIYLRADKTILAFDPQGTIYTVHMNEHEIVIANLFVWRTKVLPCVSCISHHHLHMHVNIHTKWNSHCASGVSKRKMYLKKAFLIYGQGAVWLPKNYRFWAVAHCIESE